MISLNVSTVAGLSATARSLIGDSIIISIVRVGSGAEVSNEYIRVVCENSYVSVLISRKFNCLLLPCALLPYLLLLFPSDNKLSKERACAVSITHLNIYQTCVGKLDP